MFSFQDKFCVNFYFQELLSDYLLLYSFINTMSASKGKSYRFLKKIKPYRMSQLTISQSFLTTITLPTLIIQVFNLIYCSIWESFLPMKVVFPKRLDVQVVKSIITELFCLDSCLPTLISIMISVLWPMLFYNELR